MYKQSCHFCRTLYFALLNQSDEYSLPRCYSNQKNCVVWLQEKNEIFQQRHPWYIKAQRLRGKDIEKAFDRVRDREMLYKINKFKFTSLIIRNTNTYLESRGFGIRIEKEQLTSKRMEVEIYQESVLCGFLFNMCIQKWHIAKLPNLRMTWQYTCLAELQ